VFFELIAQAAVPAAKASAAVPKLTPQQLQQLQAQLAAQSLKYQSQGTWMQQHAQWLTHTFAGIFIVAAIAFIVLLALQTTKQEGLSGTIGGRVDSNYRGRIGFEGQIARVTQMIAITFVVIATIVSLSGI
jgi:preprotein translocase subunit SecG